MSMQFKMFSRLFSVSKRVTGFTLIETIVALGLFIIIVYGIYFSFANILQALTQGQLRAEATSLIEDEFEVVRNMPYQDIGIQGGFPPGKLLAQKTVNLGGVLYTLTTTVRNMDDPFDGLAGGVPNDTAPADHKLVEFAIRCDTCTYFVPFSVTGRIAPRGLETTTNNGSLFVNAFNAFGKPVSGATVRVVNTALIPAIDITDATNNSGVLQLIDIPTSTSAYQITVSKPGYTSEKTYTQGDPQNPNPLTPHATIASQQVTSVSFAIDQVSTIVMHAFDEFCTGISGARFTQRGTKLIGKDPDVLKYSTTTIMDASGKATRANLEWDTYFFDNTTAGYDIAGTRPFLPFTLNPASSTSLFITMAPAQPTSLLVRVIDASGNALDGATATLTRTGFSSTLLTGRRAFFETDWGGGRYASQSGGLDDSAGMIRLLQSGGAYPTSTKWFVSNTLDVGTSTAAVFATLAWNPTSQPVQAGANSLQFQLASNNDNTTWNFIGPDGSSGTFYTSSSMPISSHHANKRYLRYQAFLYTQDETVTPGLSDISFEFSSQCVPPGQAFFSGIAADTYTLTVSKPGFQVFTSAALSVVSGWQEYVVTLVP